VRYLLDTCVMSELSKPSPNPGALAWLLEQADDDLFISVLTLGELRKSVAKQDDGKRKQRLLSWLEGELLEQFGSRALAFDRKAALLWGGIYGELQRQG